MSLCGCASDSREDRDRFAMSDSGLMQVAMRRAQVDARDLLVVTFFFDQS